MLKRTLFIVMALCLLVVPTSFAQDEPEPVRIAVFTFTSGPAASYGMPGRNAAELLFEQINEEGGLGGIPVEIVFVDEGQGGEAVVTEYRRLASEGVDIMIAALSSGNCLAIAPIAEELEVLTLMWNCDTHQVFEGNEYEYVYRTNSNTIPEFVSGALYLLDQQPDVETVAIINPDYAFGRDAAEIFKATLAVINPEIEVVVELFPQLGAGDYSTEISRLSASRPDAIFSNLWGGDLNTFVSQAEARGLFEQSQMVLALGTSSAENLGDTLPEGVIVGALGNGWFLTPEVQSNPEAVAFIDAYVERYEEYPSFPAFKMTQTIQSLELAVDTAMESNGGTFPTKEEIAAALDGATIETFAGTLQMREDGDGQTDQVWGVTVASDEYDFKVMDQIIRFPADLVSAPPGEPAIEWVSTLSPDILEMIPEPVSMME